MCVSVRTNCSPSPIPEHLLYSDNNVRQLRAWDSSSDWDFSVPDEDLGWKWFRSGFVVINSLEKSAKNNIWEQKGSVFDFVCWRHFKSLYLDHTFNIHQTDCWLFTCCLCDLIRRETSLQYLCSLFPSRADRKHWPPCVWAAWRRGRMNGRTRWCHQAATVGMLGMWNWLLLTSHSRARANTPYTQEPPATKEHVCRWAGAGVKPTPCPLRDGSKAATLTGSAVQFHVKS